MLCLHRDKGARICDKLDLFFLGEHKVIIVTINFELKKKTLSRFLLTIKMSPRTNQLKFSYLISRMEKKPGYTNFARYLIRIERVDNNEMLNLGF